MAALKDITETDTMLESEHYQLFGQHPHKFKSMQESRQVSDAEQSAPLEHEKSRRLSFDIDDYEAMIRFRGQTKSPIEEQVPTTEPCEPCEPCEP